MQSLGRIRRVITTGSLLGRNYSTNVFRDPQRLARSGKRALSEKVKFTLCASLSSLLDDDDDKDVDVDVGDRSIDHVGCGNGRVAYTRRIRQVDAAPAPGMWRYERTVTNARRTRLSMVHCGRTITFSGRAARVVRTAIRHPAYTPKLP